MRSTRIYHPEKLQKAETTLLSPEASHHLLNVLRFKEKEKFTLFDGHNHEYTVVLSVIRKKQVECRVIDVCHVSRESKLPLHLAQGISKGERMTFSLQKAVELGISEYTPLWTQHAAFKWDSQLNLKKMQQWEAIIIAACEQSGRNTIPKLNPIVHFKDFIENHRNANQLLLEPQNGVHWQQLRWAHDLSTTLLIGPEGGFSEQEVQDAITQNYQGLTLGPRILRTETAVISALTLLQAIKGDL